ncbi:MAG TPA: hypothetical protein VN824_05690, partial [Puia sp.]|nr:hypothetical protein [Puia sp.]
MSLHSGDTDDSPKNIILGAKNIADFLRSLRYGDIDSSAPVDLSLSDIDIQRLPGDLLKLKNLRRISIVNCKLLSFPFELRDLENLEQLTI